MCVVALTAYLWNRPVRLNLKKALIYITYRNRYGEYKNNVYDTEIVSRSPDDCELKVYVIRSGGGISCTVTAKRNSTQEGSEVVFTDHSQHHLSGLRELYKLYKNRIAYGDNQGSKLYRRFEGETTDDTRRRYRMMCEVINSQEQYVPVLYEIELKYLYD